MGQSFGCGFDRPVAYLRYHVSEAPDLYVAVAPTYRASYVILSYFWWDPLYGKRMICPQFSSR